MKKIERELDIKVGSRVSLPQPFVFFHVFSFSQVQQLMTDTWLPHFTRDRHLSCGGRVPIGCRVANVLRVENHRAYARYLSYKHALKLKRPRPCTPFPVRTSDRINLLDHETWLLLISRLKPLHHNTLE